MDNHTDKWCTVSKKECKLSYIGDFFNKERNIQYILNNIIIFKSNKIEKIGNFMNNIDGFFSFIYEDKYDIFAVIDRIGAYPLFYSFDNNSDLLLSNDAHVLKEKNDIQNQNDNGVLEFLLSGYVLENETLFKNLFRLKAGQYLWFNKKTNRIHVDNYFFYPTIINGEKEKIGNDGIYGFKKLLFNCFTDLKNNIVDNDFIPVVPLSGGIDSRLIAVMLKNVGLKNVICYTFGTKNHPEVVTSKKIARKLGFEWKFSEYTKEKWNQRYNDEIKKEYAIFADGLSVKPHFMEFIAVEELFKSNPDNYLFLPGHSLDFLAGSHLDFGLVLNNAINFENVIEHLFQKHFSYHYVSKKDKNIIKREISKELMPLKSKNDLDFRLLFEYFDWIERQGKLIINSLNVYDYFGFKWYIPFWEKEYMSFFSKIPYSLKYNRKLLLMWLYQLFPDFFSEYTPKDLFLSTTELCRHFLINFFSEVHLEDLFYLFFIIKKRKNLSKNYGLNRFGAFDTTPIDIVDFSKKYRNSDVNKIFYFFTLNHLNNFELNLEFLDDYYFITK